MADVTTTPLDRGRYPILERKVGRAREASLVYLDSAATALVSTAVTDAHAAFLHTSCANIHRGAHLLAEEATDAYECVRERLARHLGVADAGRMVLTHGATESLNLAALGWAIHHLRPGDVVAVAEDNHHSNIVPWLAVAERTGAEVSWIPLDGDGLLDYGVWGSIACRRPRVVALCEQSNVLGFRQPSLGRIAADAREVGSVIVVDGAQAAAHGPVAPASLYADFYACSAHKMGGLTGVGALACSERVFDAMSPVYGGGGMAASVGRDGWEAVEGPGALEAGTPAIAAAVAWGAALEEREAAGVAVLADHARRLAQRARRGLSAIRGVSVLGGAVPAPMNALVSFTVDGVHPHDVSQRLSDAGVMVRAGHHCARPLHAALGVRASVRASFAGYNGDDDVDVLIRAVKELRDKRRAV